MERNIFYNSSDGFLKNFFFCCSLCGERKISTGINSSSAGWLSRPVPSLWPCTPSFLHGPPLLRLSLFSVAHTNTHTYINIYIYTVDLTHNRETCKELNLSAEYRQMKLEIEKGQSGLKEKKRKEGEKKFSKYKTLLPMDSLALAFLSPTKQRSKNHRYKKKKKNLGCCLCPTFSSSTALTQSDGLVLRYVLYYKAYLLYGRERT